MLKYSIGRTSEILKNEEVKVLLTERINKAVEESGMKQKAIAERMGISEQVLSAIMTGKRKIYADEFFKLCAAINRRPSEVYPPAA